MKSPENSVNTWNIIRMYCTRTPSVVTENKLNESSLLHLKTEEDCFRKSVSVCVFSDKRKSHDNVSDVSFVSLLL